MFETRAARIDDTDLILSFIKALADYEKAPEAVTATPDDIRARLFGPHASVHGLIFEIEGRPIGFAVYFFNFSTWLGRHGLFLEDLYIAPEHRQHGHGRAAMHALARLAVETGCARFEWNVLDWNTPAIRLYETIGATAQNEWIGYRMEAETLRRFVADG